MSEPLISPSNTTVKKPYTTYLKDYAVPAYLIDDVDLNFDLYDDYVRVKSLLRIRRNRFSTTRERDLILNGIDLKLESIRLDDQALTQDKIKIDDTSLTIFEVPDNFDLEIITNIYPQKNTALSGLYRSNNAFCTQCEAQGFRRITYFLDRPDVLSRYTTTISADAARYPILLSNGNLVDSGKLADGRHWVKWEDPFKKPSYLFALVAGDFDVLQDQFITQSEREIQLQIYVEKGYG